MTSKDTRGQISCTAVFSISPTICISRGSPLPQACPPDPKSAAGMDLLLASRMSLPIRIFLERSLDVTSCFRCSCGCHRLQPCSGSGEDYPDKLYRRMVFDITSRQNDYFTHCQAGLRINGCTKILSIQQNGFFVEGRHCKPVNMRLRRDIGPTSIAYIATITARCQPDGPVTAGTLQTFEFNRNKGNLMVTTK